MSSKTTSKFMFTDGSHIYQEYNKQHTQGYVILGPPHKIYFIIHYSYN